MELKRYHSEHTHTIPPQATCICGAHALKEIFGD